MIRVLCSMFYVPPHFFSKKSGEGQAAIGFVFLATGIIILMSISFIVLVISFINSGIGFQSAQQAAFSANAGVEDALMHISRKKDFNSPGYALPVDSGSLTVTVTAGAPSVNQSTVVSRASYKGVTRIFEAIVSIHSMTGTPTVISWSQIAL